MAPIEADMRFRLKLNQEVDMSNIVRGAIVKGDKGQIMLQLDPIPLEATARYDVDSDGMVKRATMFHGTNRSTGKGTTVIVPIKGLKAEAPYLSVTLSAEIEAVKALGFKLVRKEQRNGAVKVRRGIPATDLA